MALLRSRSVPPDLAHIAAAASGFVRSSLADVAVYEAPERDLGGKEPDTAMLSLGLIFS
jgi:hypothetical protein